MLFTYKWKIYFIKQWLDDFYLQRNFRDFGEKSKKKNLKLGFSTKIVAVFKENFSETYFKKFIKEIYIF